MEDRAKRLFKELGKICGRVGLAYLAFLFISTVMSLTFYVGGSLIKDQMNLEEQYVHMFSCIVLPFAIYSVNRAFELYDRNTHRVFLERMEGKYRLLRDIKISFSDKRVLSKTLIGLLLPLLIIIVLPYGAGYLSVVGSIWPDLDMEPSLANLVSDLIVAPCYLLIVLLAKTSAHKWWFIAHDAEKLKLLSLKSPNLRLFLETVKIFFIYSISFYALPAVIMLVVSFALTFALLNNPALWITIGVIILLIVSLRNIVAMRRRAKFVKRLRTAIKECGYEATPIKRPILSVIFPRCGADTIIKKGDKVYALKMLAAVRRGAPVYISPEGVSTAKVTVGFLRFDFFHIMMDTYYRFDAPEGALKILVYTPMPRKLYINYGRTDLNPNDGSGGFNTYGQFHDISAKARATSGGIDIPTEGSHSMITKFRGPGFVSDIDRGIIKPLQTGDKVGEYKVFTPDGVISAMENNCLER